MLAFLQACATSAPPPDTFYYVLDPAPKSFAVKNAETEIKILPVTLPDYMNQPNLVIKLSDHQIKITNYHYWADDLRQSVQRVVINELNQLNNTVNFTQQCRNCINVEISIDHYYPTEGGDVLLAGTYVVIGTNAKQNINSFSFSTSLSDGGFDESVAKMRELLDALSAEINNSLSTLN